MLQKTEILPKNEMSPKKKSLKLKCHKNLNVTKTRMLQEPNVIKTRRSALIALALFMY